jgi:hypothetical protein
LGINVDVDLDKIVNINYNERILQIKKLIKIWSKRNLTVIGKITVVKTPILPVLNHLIITLPNPTQDILKKVKAWNTSFQNLFFTTFSFM